MLFRDSRELFNESLRFKVDDPIFMLVYIRDSFGDINRLNFQNECFF